MKLKYDKLRLVNEKYAVWEIMEVEQAKENELRWKTKAKKAQNDSEEKEWFEFYKKYM